MKSAPHTHIRVIDLETTGFAPPAEPIEIGWCDVYATRGDLAGAPCGWKVDRHGQYLIRPVRPIPPETSAIHHLTAEDFGPDAIVHDWERDGRQVARPTLDQPMELYAAHNARFERQFIGTDWTEGAPWICTWKCALRLWPEAPSHSNQTLRYWRGLPVDRRIADKAHRAGPDAYVTAHLLRDMLDQPGVTLSQLIAWSDEPALLARCGINPYRGTPWREIGDPSWLRWVLARDFNEEVLFTARRRLDELRAEAEARALQTEEA